MITVPAHSFCDPTRAQFIAAARNIPGVCAVLLSRRSLLMTRTPSLRQSCCDFEDAVMVLAILHVDRKLGLNEHPARAYSAVGGMNSESNIQASWRRGIPELPLWTILAPVLAGIVIFLAGYDLGLGGIFVAVIAVSLAASVFAAVHHAEVVAHRIGEPYGSLVLALAVTLIEVALIVSLMVAGGAEAAALARDTVFAAVMIILNGIIGLCLLVGGLKHREQTFSLDGVSAALVALAAIVILTLVFPNFTVTTPGPYYSASQLLLIAVVSLAIYGAFVFAQTIGHRGIFVQDDPAGEQQHA